MIYSVKKIPGPSQMRWVVRAFVKDKNYWVVGLMDKKAKAFHYVLTDRFVDRFGDHEQCSRVFAEICPYAASLPVGVDTMRKINGDIEMAVAEMAKRSNFIDGVLF